MTVRSLGGGISVSKAWKLCEMTPVQLQDKWHYEVWEWQLPHTTWEVDVTSLVLHPVARTPHSHDLLVKIEHDFAQALAASSSEHIVGRCTIAS